MDQWSVSDISSLNGKFPAPYEEIYQEFKKRLMQEVVVSIEGDDLPMMYGPYPANKYHPKAKFIVLVDRGKDHREKDNG